MLNDYHLFLHTYNRSKDNNVKQTSKFYEEGKYAKESARNYDDHVSCILLSILAFLPLEFPL